MASTWNGLVNELKEATFTKSKETSNDVTNGAHEHFKALDNRRKLFQHIKRAKHFKMCVLVVITLVSFGFLIHQGIICMSKYVNKHL